MTPSHTHTRPRRARRATNPLRLGVHVSIAGGLVAAVRRAEALGCHTMQVFSKSPRGWAAKALDPDDAQRAYQLRQELGIGTFAVHAPYLINLASSDPHLYAKSIAAVVDELDRCRMIRADFLVLHVGSTKADQPDGLQRVATALQEVLKVAAPGPRILLENTAGERGEVGSSLEELHELMRAVSSGRIGVCLDTCHTFAAGYDVRTRSGVRALAHTIEQTVGFDAIQLIHANDSKHGLGCRLDRHEHIGSGGIGENGFSAWLAHERLRAISMVLETPKDSEEDDPRNLRALRRLAR